MTGPCFGPHIRKRLVSRRALLRRCRTRDGSQFCCERWRRAAPQMLTHLNARPPGIHPWQLATYNCTLKARPRAHGSPGMSCLGVPVLWKLPAASWRRELPHDLAPQVGVTGRVPMANQVAPRQPGPPTSMQKKVWSKAGRAPLPRSPSLPLAICQTHPPQRQRSRPTPSKVQSY